MHWLVNGIVSLAVIALLGIVGIYLLAWRPVIDPVAPPWPTEFTAAEIARGKALAGAGNCAVCHTQTGGETYAGGRGMPTPFGTVYATNITPDETTGIGRWSEAAFVRAMREGVGPAGQHYFPAFPYTHFTRVSHEDLRAIYAYLMMRPAVDAPARENSISFPFNIRALQAGWKLLFFDDERFVPAVEQDGQWNRGAYLAEGLGHCSACHTPRNLLGAEQRSAKYSGALVDGWYAPALNANSTDPVRWSRQGLYDYLRSGASRYHGVAVGSMSEVVHIGLRELPDDDIAALAHYFGDNFGDNFRDNRQSADSASRPPEAFRLDEARLARAGSAQAAGEQIFANACASCHYNRATALLTRRPELSINSAVTAPNPANLLRVVLHGVEGAEGMPNQLMPGFAKVLSDAEIIALADYLRAAAGVAESWPDLATAVADARQRLAGH